MSGRFNISSTSVQTYPPALGPAISFPRFIIPPIASASNVWQNGSSHITALSFSFNTFERVTIVSQCVYASGNVSPSPSVTSERIPAELSYVQLKSFISPIFLTLPLRITKIGFPRFIRDFLSHSFLQFLVNFRKHKAIGK